MPGEEARNGKKERGRNWPARGLFFRVDINLRYKIERNWREKKLHSPTCDAVSYIEFLPPRTINNITIIIQQAHHILISSYSGPLPVQAPNPSQTRTPEIPVFYSYKTQLLDCSLHLAAAAVHVKFIRSRTSLFNHGKSAPCLPVITENVPMHGGPVCPTPALSRTNALGRFHEACPP